MFLGFSTQPYVQLRLPAGDKISSKLQMSVHIRDKYDCVKKYQMQSIIVVSDLIDIDALVNVLQKPNNEKSAHPLLRLLENGNQNTVGQVITSLSQELNKRNDDNIKDFISDEIPVTNIAVSPLNGEKVLTSSAIINASVFANYKKQLNMYATIRDHLMMTITNVPITTIGSIKLQASTLAELTEATNQLTRTAAVQASKKCHQLAIGLQVSAARISYEDVQTAATHIAQCASNTLNAINIPLHRRGIILDLDLDRANSLSTDYDSNFEFDLSDHEDFSEETIRIRRNSFYQKQSAKTILAEVDETISLITAAVSVHLNIDQRMIINTSSLFFSLERISFESLSNKSIQSIDRALMHIPSDIKSDLKENASVLLRSMIKPLPPTSDFQSRANINLSTSLSLSILDLYGIEVPIRTTIDHPIEFIIPHDVNLVVPSMFVQNVTSKPNDDNLLFNLHAVNITQSNSNLTTSLHLEIHPLNKSLAYLLIYKLDDSPVLTFSNNHTDGWTLFCPLNLTKDDMYTYYINNRRTANHQWVVFSVRELNSTECEQFCLNKSNNNGPPLTNLPFHFSSDYELRTYLSGCYYLDLNNIWQSNGLLVGPLTNHNQTQCFSTHLTTFASGFLMVQATSYWNHISTIIKHETDQCSYAKFVSAIQSKFA